MSIPSYCFLLSALASASAADKLTIQTEDLAVTLESEAAWTIRSVVYKGDRLIIPAGGQGAVIAPKDGTWMGSVMGGKESEPVSAVTVTASGEAVDIEPSLTVEGDDVVVRKSSTLGGLRHTAETSFEEDLFVQRHAFVAEEEVTLRSFYAFIYSFTPSAKSWLAKPLRGKIQRGVFAQDGSHKPSVPCSWLAQYDPANAKGALVYLQTTFSGNRASMHFWDTKGYHKFLAQPLTGTVAKGTELDYTLVVQFFSAPEDEWETVAQELAAKLADRFPQKGAPMAPVKKLYGEGVPETGDHECKTTRYTVLFEARPAWTIRRIDFDGQTVARPTGWYGTVMVPKGGRWWGTGHAEGGAEVVHSLRLTVDGQDRPIGPDSTSEGKEITLTKESTIWKFRAHVEVTITDDHIYERTQLTPIEDCELALMYYYMHCFVPSTTTWAAGLPDGRFETGPLDHNKGFSVNKDVRWLAQYEPDLGVSILCYTPKVVTGERSMSKIWNQPHYHKYYIQQNQGQAFEKGQKLDYSVVVKVVPGEAGDWEATKAAARALAEAYPPVGD